MKTRRLLVVDDDDAIRRLLVEYFRASAASTVHTARDGAEALHRLSTGAYDVVVLDMVMPHMTGIDLLHSLDSMRHDRLNTMRSSPGIVVITSTPESELPEHVLRGFTDLVIGVFRKPLDILAVVACVDAHLH